MRQPLGQQRCLCKNYIGEVRFEKLDAAHAAKAKLARIEPAAEHEHQQLRAFVSGDCHLLEQGLVKKRRAHCDVGVMQSRISASQHRAHERACERRKECVRYFITSYRLPPEAVQVHVRVCEALAQREPIGGVQHGDGSRLELPRQGPDSFGRVPRSLHAELRGRGLEQLRGRKPAPPRRLERPGPSDAAERYQEKATP